MTIAYMCMPNNTLHTQAEAHCTLVHAQKDA